MTDIVERLRGHVEARGGAKIENGAWSMMIDAADEIDRLRKEVERLETKVYGDCDKCDAYIATNAMLKGALAANKDWMARASRAEAKVEEMAKALRELDEMIFNDPQIIASAGRFRDHIRAALAQWIVTGTDETCSGSVERSEIEPDRPAADAPKENRDG